MTTILGPDGRPLDLSSIRRTVREPQTANVGGLQLEFDKHPAKGLTPARLAVLMQQAEQGDLVGQLELTADMEERDAHMYAELGKRRGAITALPWSIEEPENANAEEEALTEQVRDWVGMLTAHANGVNGGMGVLVGAMTAGVLPGFAPIELVWNLQADAEGRQVLVPHCTLQPHTWFTTSADRHRFLLRSQTKMTAAVPIASGGVLPGKMGEELQPFSWLMHVHPATNGYLARMSLARVLFWPYLFKNYAVRDLAEFLEIYGLPLRLGRYPSGASDEEKMTLLRAVTQIGHNAAGIIPQGMVIDFQNASAGTEVPFAAMWDRLDAAQSKAILGQTLSASEGSKGSHALGKVHNDVRMDIREADARLYEESFSRQVIAPMCALNKPGVNMRRLPRLVIDTGEPEDLQVYADNLPKLAKAGLKIGTKFVYSKLRIPKPEAGEELLQVAEPAPAPGEPGAPGAAGQPGTKPAALPQRKAAEVALRALLATALAGRVAVPAVPAVPALAEGQNVPDLVDDLAAELAAEWQPVMNPLLAPLMGELDKAVAAGESLAQWAARMPDLVRLMDAQTLAELVAQAGFSAHLAGAADLDLS